MRLTELTGGGIFASITSGHSSLIRHSVLQGNSPYQGGGLKWSNAPIALVNVTYLDNSAVYGPALTAVECVPVAWYCPLPWPWRAPCCLLQIMSTPAVVHLRCSVGFSYDSCCGETAAPGSGRHAQLHPETRKTVPGTVAGSILPT